MATRILILLILAGVLIAPEDLSSCGPFLPEAVFTAKLEPLDTKRFFAGHLDILQPRYRRIYLIVAYRYLAGTGLNPADQEALEAQPASNDAWSGQDSPAVQSWLAARVQVGAPPIEHIDRYKLLPTFVSVLACGDDAFRNAAASLVERGRAGASHDDLRAWVAAQDQVFANCTSAKPWERDAKQLPPSIPPPLATGAAPWMQADRAYQIAAAEFYAGQFDAADADFTRIAQDRASPWHAIAPYLAARALIRKATLVDPSAAPAAQAQLAKVLADPEASPWHESARGLSRFLRIQAEPDRVLAELADNLEKQRMGVAGAMNDYRLLLDRYWDHGKQPPRDTDITDWIGAMQNNSGEHALVKWRETRSLPWLVAALTYADQPDTELMAAAAQVDESSPAFRTVEFHRLRLMPAADARPHLDAVLRGKLAKPARNLLLAERMRVARNWDELLKFAPRTEAATSYYDLNDTEPLRAPARKYFDDDAARILDSQAPLAVLLAAAANQNLPANLRLDIARAVWVRAVLLGKDDTARAVAPGLAALAPALKPYVDGYLSAPDEKSREFAAAWLILNNPGMSPWIPSGYGRTTRIPELDQLRDNWWCPADMAQRPMNGPLQLLYQGSAAEASFASATERIAALAEHKRLASTVAAPTWLARQSVEWAAAHPEDPRVPDALRLAVRAGHYACSGDSNSARWMKRAFELLHSRYGKTEAARRTPYWYGSPAH